MYLITVFLPFFGACSGFFGRWIGNSGVALITTTCLISSFLINSFLFYEVAFLGSACHFQLMP